MFAWLRTASAHAWLPIMGIVTALIVFRTSLQEASESNADHNRSVTGLAGQSLAFAASALLDGASKGPFLSRIL